MAKRKGKAKVCILCHAQPIYGRKHYCSTCLKFKDTTHPCDYSIVRSFFFNPDYVELSKEYLFPTPNQCLNTLIKFKIRLRAYTTSFLIANYDKYVKYTQEELETSFYFDRNVKFNFIFRHLLPPGGLKDTYTEVYAMIQAEAPFNAIMAKYPQFSATRLKFFKLALGK